MTRDDRDLFTDNAYQGSYTLNNIVYASGVQTFHRARTYRDNSTPTTPVGGKYVESTEYDAFFSFMDTYPYDVIFDHGKRRDKGTAATFDLCVPYSLFYGCQVSRPHRPLVPGSLINSCRDAAISKIRASDVDLGVMLGELPDAISTVTNALATVVRLYRAIRNRNPGEARAAIKQHFASRGHRDPGGHPRRIPREPAQAWLEYQYGWKPMMNDIYNVCKLLDQGLDSDICSVRVARLDKSYKLPVPSNLVDGHPQTRIDGKVKRGVEVGLSFGIANRTVYNLNSMGLINPLSIAWELTPFSFVFDWFLPLGNFLESLTIGLGTTFKTGYQTIFLKNDIQATWMFESRVDASGTFHGGLRTTSMYRSLLSTWPYPVPHLTSGLSASQILNGIALIMATRP